LCKVPPFDGFNFGTFVRALSGQIHRGHYLFTVKDGDLAGYAGWAMCTEEVARAWVEGRRNPSFEECASGDCWVGMTFYAATREANFYQARRCRRLYPNCKVFWNRQYADGRPKRRATTYNLIGEAADPGESG
jgi:hemolysin-activating ACP:hemolysin acyltransferase